MARKSETRPAKSRAARSSTVSASNDLSKRIAVLEEAVDFLMHRVVHEEHVDRATPEQLEALALGVNERYVKRTSDGWLVVLAAGERVSLPSGLLVHLDRTAGGRDYLTVLEGVHRGRAVDVVSGYLDGQAARVDQLKMQVARRSAGPVVIDGISYDLEAKLSFVEGGTAKSAGPYSAKTDPQNPLPAGRHEIEIPDFPHGLGDGYGAFGTVWFRIGRSGDRYVHPGRVSAGCLTCAPSSWREIYEHLSKGRIAGDYNSIGLLEVVM